jgi:hypothetical protein
MDMTAYPSKKSRNKTEPCIKSDSMAKMWTALCRRPGFPESYANSSRIPTHAIPCNIELERLGRPIQDAPADLNYAELKHKQQVDISTN